MAKIKSAWMRELGHRRVLKSIESVEIYLPNQIIKIYIYFLIVYSFAQDRVSGTLNDSARSKTILLLLLLLSI